MAYFFMENHMRFFILLMLISILKAAQPLDTSYLWLPHEVKEWIDMFKNVTEVDESGKSIKTLREVKKIMDPLKVAFDNYFTRDRFLRYMKHFKPCLEQHIKYFKEKLEKEIDQIVENRLKEVEDNKDSYDPDEYQSKIEMRKDRYIGPRFGTREYIILKVLIPEYDLFDMNFTPAEYRTHRRKNPAPLSFSINLNLTEEEFNTYFPIELQKIFFIPTVYAALADVFKTCNFIFDRRQWEDPVETDDINSILDAPFVFLPYANFFEVEGGWIDTPVSPDFLKRLHENIAFMLDHHVRFFDIQAEDNVSK
ncbi:MAG: hypothetical protein CNLJKLNK_01267 [Holosporales bacterium]